MPDGVGSKNVSFTDSGCALELSAGWVISTPAGIRKGDTDSFGTGDALGSMAEWALVGWPGNPAFRGLASPIPGLLGLGGPGPAASPGSGWEVTVLSHTDFATPLAVLNYASLQFAKLLKDKGSGTVVLNRDDRFLFPPAAASFTANPDFPGGSLSGWAADTAGGGGTVTLNASQAQLWQNPWSLRVTPTGGAVHAYASGTGDLFPVIPGEVYLVTAMGWCAEAWVTYTGPLPPGMGTAPLQPCFGAGLLWFDQNRQPLPAPYTATRVTTAPAVITPASAWTGVSSGPIAAPPGAQYACATIGIDSVGAASPPSGAHPYFQHVCATTDAGNTTPGEQLAEHENVWRVSYSGLPCFEFLGQTVTDQVDDASEQRLATITGPGTVDVLRWAAAMPPGFPDIVFKTDSIQDGFAEVDTSGNPLLDVSIWNQSGPADHITLAPSGTCQITASPGGTVLGAQPYDITGSSISFQVGAISGAGLDGSQVTQLYVADLQNPGNLYALVGLTSTQFYARVSTGPPGPPVGGTGVYYQVTTKSLGGYDPNGDAYWRISEDGQGNFVFWTSGDGNSWTDVWKVPHSGGWDPTSVGVYVSAKYDTDNAQFATVTNVNGDIITPSSAGNIFVAEPIMSVWWQLWQAAQARGTIPFVTSRLTPAHDSFGNPWADGMSVQVANGTDLYSLLQGYCGIVNADWLMQPGFVLQVGLPLGGPSGGIGLGRDLTKTVVLHEGAQILTRQRVRARDQLANLIGAVNSDGTVVVAQDAASQAEWWQREAWIQTAEQVNPASMAIVTGASLDQTRDEILSWTLTVPPDAPGARVFTDYDVGDWIGVERPGCATSVVDSFRVIGIAINVDATATQVTCELTLNSYRQWLSEQFAYLVSKFGGQFINTIGTTPVTSTMTSATQLPTVVAPNLGGLGNVALG